MSSTPWHRDSRSTWPSRSTRRNSSTRSRPSSIGRPEGFERANISGRTHALIFLARTRAMAPYALSRRTVLKQLGLVRVGLAIGDGLGRVPPAPAQSDPLVPVTDIPATFNPTASGTNSNLDIRKI